MERADGWLVDIDGWLVQWMKAGWVGRGVVV